MISREELDRLIRHSGNPCVTLICPAARTIPDALQVPIRLKVMLSQAEQRLHQEYDKAIAAPLVQRLKEAIEAVDERRLLDGVVLLVNREISKKVDLPFPVEERIVIDRTFATRDIIRANLTSMAFHVLVLGLEKATLMEAYADRVVSDAFMGFPIHDPRFPADPLTASTGRTQVELPRLFFKEVDQAVLGVVGQQGHVVIASVSEHYGPFREASERPRTYIGNLPGNWDRASAHDIVKAAWSVAYEYQKEMQLAEVAKISNAPVNRTAIDVADIWRRIRDGRGQLLLVERDLRKPALVEGDQVQLLDDATKNNAVDDLVDEIIEQQLKYGGEVRVLPNGALDKYGGIALLMRY